MAATAKRKTVRPTTRTTARPTTLARTLGECPRAARVLRDGRTEYLGVTIAQAPRAWSRMGPTWCDVRGRYWVLGPGVADWGTSQGLAELSVSTAPAAKWHAVGLVCCPSDTLLFAVEAEVVAARPQIAGLAAEAEAWEEAGRP